MNNEQLVDMVTAIIMQRIAAAEADEAAAPAGRKVVVYGEVPDGLLGSGCQVRAGRSASDTDGADYIVLTAAAFRAFHGGAIPAGLTGVVSPAAAPAPAASWCAQPADRCGCGPVHDLTGKKLIGERDVLSLNLTRGAVVKIGPNSIVTALARDIARSRGAEIIR